jgi:hypothetical protein
MFIFFIVLTSILFLFLLFLVFIRPLFRYQGKLSRNIREVTFSGIITIDNTIITICSAGIVLTVQFIDKSLINKQYLVISWISFCISIVFGIIILIGHFTHNLIDEVMIKEFEKLSEVARNKEMVEEAGIILKRQRFLTKSLFVLIYFQTVALFISLLCLVLFGIENIRV